MITRKESHKIKTLIIIIATLWILQFIFSIMSDNITTDASVNAYERMTASEQSVLDDYIYKYAEELEKTNLTWLSDVYGFISILWLIITGILFYNVWKLEEEPKDFKQIQERIQSNLQTPQIYQQVPVQQPQPIRVQPRPVQKHYATCSYCGNNFAYRLNPFIDEVYKCPVCGYRGHIRYTDGRMMLER